jgi:hypothetical protein
VQKRLLINLLLLIVVCILTTFFILNDKPDINNPETLLSNIDTSSISHITINQANSEDINFQIQGNHWFLTSPIKARANRTRINAMLHLLQSRSLAQIDAQNASLALYRLDPAAITLHLDKHTFFFGTTDPLDDRRYIMFNNTIHLVSDHLYHQLRQSPIFFVSPRLVPDQEEISSIQFTGRRISKVNGYWSVSPSNSDIGAEQLGDLIAAWQTGEARQIRQYLATDNVEEKIVVHFTSGHSAQFNVISKTPSLVLGRVDLALQYHLEMNLSDRLFIAVMNHTDK